jgi:hypothetical protein
MKRTIFALAFVLYASVALAQWQPSVGIPVPPFGIVEVAPAPTVYVNEATGSDGNQGTPARPRKTIPTQLEAGTVVSVTGTYTYSHGSPASLEAHGTADRPVYIIGGNFTRGGELTGSYAILEKAGGPGGWTILDTRAGKPSDHLVIRDYDSTGGISVASWRGAAVSDVVLLRVTVNLGYTNQRESDGDWHCSTINVSPGTAGKVERLWVLDSTLSGCRGDGIQVNGNTGGELTMGPVYLGRLTCVHNRQTCVGVKQSHDVVISDLRASEMRPDGDHTNPGAGIVAQYYARRLAILSGEISNSENGIIVASYADEAMAAPERSGVLIYGVKIHNIHATAGTFEPGNSRSPGAAIVLVGASQRQVESVVIDDVDRGISVAYGTFIDKNNTVTNVKPGGPVITPVPPVAKLPPCPRTFLGALAYIAGRCSWSG